MRILRLIAIALVVSLAWIQPAMAGVEVDQIAANIMCQCGCTMILNTCTCGTSDQMRAVIREKLDQGQSPQQIIDYFVEQYGEKVLSAPTKQGFNLTAWTLPFIAIAVGGAGITFLLRQWVGRQRRAPLSIPAATPEVWRRYEEQFQRELEEFV